MSVNRAPVNGTGGPRRSRRRLIVLGVLFGVAIWAAFVAFTFVRARSDTRAGIDTLVGVQNELSPGDLLRGEHIDELRAAGADFHRARNRGRCGSSPSSAVR